jgi:hypothetical protein
MVIAISSQCVSRAKCPVSKNVTFASLMSRSNASAPAGKKNGSPLPQTASRAADAGGSTLGTSDTYRHWSRSRGTGPAVPHARRGESSSSCPSCRPSGETRDVSLTPVVYCQYVVSGVNSIRFERKSWPARRPRAYPSTRGVWQGVGRSSSWRSLRPQCWSRSWRRVLPSR